MKGVSKRDASNRGHADLTFDANGIEAGTERIRETCKTVKLMTLTEVVPK
jgi:hypothetical protein